MSVRMKELDFHLWDFYYLISASFSKTRQGNSSFIKIRQERLLHYTKTHIYFWWNLDQFFSESEMFQTKVAQKVTIHILWSITFSPEIAPFMRRGKKNRTGDQATYDNIIQRMRIVRWIPKAKNARSKYAILQQSLQEHASVLRYTYTAWLVYTVFRFTLAFTACPATAPCTPLHAEYQQPQSWY